MIIESSYLKDYKRLLSDLNSFSSLTNSKLISETDSDYFINNANFFTKSLMVLICAYLESYLKDISMHLINHYKTILDSNPIPENIIKWSLQTNKDFKEKDFVFKPFKIKIDKKTLDEEISGSPFRTITLFKKLGIELHKSEDFIELKDKINSIVVKRNKIVHHNDNASDLTFSDITENITIIQEYIKLIDRIVMKKTSL